MTERDSGHRDEVVDDRVHPVPPKEAGGRLGRRGDVGPDREEIGLHPVPDADGRPVLDLVTPVDKGNVTDSKGRDVRVWRWRLLFPDK